MLDLYELQKQLIRMMVPPVAELSAVVAEYRYDICIESQEVCNTLLLSDVIGSLLVQRWLQA